MGSLANRNEREKFSNRGYEIKTVNKTRPLKGRWEGNKPNKHTTSVTYHEEQAHETAASRALAPHHELSHVFNRQTTAS